MDWRPNVALSTSRPPEVKVGETVIVCRLPIIGKNGRLMQPFCVGGGNFCRPGRLWRMERSATF